MTCRPNCPLLYTAHVTFDFILIVARTRPLTINIWLHSLNDLHTGPEGSPSLGADSGAVILGFKLCLSIPGGDHPPPPSLSSPSGGGAQILIDAPPSQYWKSKPCTTQSCLLPTNQARIRNIPVLYIALFPVFFPL